MSYEYWKNHFETNRSHFEDIDWDIMDGLVESEKRLITKSLQQFQKGEHSEGKDLFSCARSFGNPLYVECIRIFICEEQKHAMVLGRYMDKENIPKIREHWMVNIFRWLRKRAGLENTLTVLLVAEVISKVYYKALANATLSEILKKICKQILYDEDYHIAFQVYTLGILYQRRSWLGKLFTRTWNSVLMTGTIFVVWSQHARVLKAGGFSFMKFMLETLLVYVEADRQIRKITNNAMNPVRL